MEKLIVIGPNLPDQSKGSFHVHAQGCLALNVKSYYPSPEFDFDRTNAMEFDSVQEIAEFVYADMLDENEVTDLLSDFYVHTCVDYLPTTPLKKEAPKMHTVTVEIYTADMWIELSIETDSPNETVTALRALPRTRNIRIAK